MYFNILKDDIILLKRNSRNLNRKQKIQMKNIFGNNIFENLNNIILYIA